MLSKELELRPGDPDSHQAQMVSEVLDRLGPTFVQRSSVADKTGVFPVSNIKDIYEMGLIALLVPITEGGAGLSSAAYCAAMARLAASDVTTALAFNMHSVALLSISLLAESRQKQNWIGRIIEQGAIVAALGSEPGLKPFLDGGLPNTKLISDGSGYRLTGVKSYSSFGPHADYLYVTATLDNKVAFAVIDAHAEGISRSDDWDVTSMKATQSVTTRFDHVWIDSCDVVHPPSLSAALLLEVEFALGYAPIYLGLACAAADHAFSLSLEGTTRDSVREAELAGLFGELVSKTRPAWLASIDAAKTNAASSVERARAIVLAKSIGADVACEVAQAAFRLHGGRSLRTTDPVGRAFRDVQAAQVMAFSPPMARNLLGLLGLGRPPYYLHNLIQDSIESKA